MHTALGTIYGPIANFFADQVPYVVSNIKIGNVPQAGDQEMEDTATPHLNAIRISVITDRAKKKRELRDEQPNICNRHPSKDKYSIATSHRNEW